MMDQDTIQRRASRIADGLIADAKVVTADRDLTADAKRRRVHELHRAAKDRMDDLRAEVRASREADLTSASKGLMGQYGKGGADAISVRDATDRAQRLEKVSEARELLTRARANRDEILERAILFEASERSKQPIFGGVWANLVRDEANTGSYIAGQLQAKVTAEEGLRNGADFSAIAVFLLPRPDDLLG